MENKSSAKIKSPVWIDRVPCVSRARRFTYLWFLRFKWAALQISSAVVLLIFLAWLSVFLYGSFHHQYMPLATSFERPVYLKFRTDCDSSSTLCSFPFANISLVTTSGIEVLLRGQPYVIKVELEMPESYVNQNLGMFMIQIQFYTMHGEVVSTASRAAMMQFKSALYRIFETVWLLPSFFLGRGIQKQTISVEMANEYLVDPYRPTIGLLLEVQSKRIEIYNVSLKINARLFGLRYLLYYWPTMSAVVGIATNFFFIALLAVFSYAAYVGRTTKALRLSSETSRTRKEEDGDIKPDSTSARHVELVGEVTKESVSFADESNGGFAPLESSIDGVPPEELCSAGDELNESKNYFVGTTLRHRPVTKED